jgi:cysteine desulfurase family protein (TIGR01976 family)
MNEQIRQQFPALQRLHNGQPLIFLDGPGGTQVPDSVIDAISNYYRQSNANSHGAFITAQETDVVLDNCRLHMATLLNAPSVKQISLGQNMTSLNFSLAKAIGKTLQAGDEILITQLDHEANRGPWLSLREHGIIVKEVKLLPEGVLDYDDLAQKLNHRTRLVAMGLSSNIIGTVNDIPRVRKMTHEAGAWLMLDAVHYAPHFPIDVQALGCDFLICSAYKFYGPHVGILYCKEGLLDRLQPDRLRTTDQYAPYSIETGTLNHAALAGVSAAVEFLAAMGQGDTLREQIVNAMQSIQKHEHVLAKQLYDGLAGIKGIQIYGQSMHAPLRAPTISFTTTGKTPASVCQHLAKANICAWDGHFYAIRATEVLGLLEKGGLTRMGISVYTTAEEIEKTLIEVEKIAQL